MDLGGHSMLDALSGGSVSLKDCTFNNITLHSDATVTGAVFHVQRAESSLAGGMFRLEDVYFNSSLSKSPLLLEVLAVKSREGLPLFYSNTRMEVGCEEQWEGPCKGGVTAPLAEAEKLPSHTFLTMQSDWLKTVQNVRCLHTFQDHLLSSIELYRVEVRSILH